MRPLMLVLVGAGACHTTSVVESDADDTSADTDDADADGDGFDATDDCDDGDAQVFPGAIEGCRDGRDEDCDDRIDEACSSERGDAALLLDDHVTSSLILPDLDGDAYGELVVGHHDEWEGDYATIVSGADVPTMPGAVQQAPVKLRIEGVGWNTAWLGDVDGDGLDDIALDRAIFTGTQLSRTGTATGEDAWIEMPSWPRAVGDLDADGRSDIGASGGWVWSTSSWVAGAEVYYEDAVRLEDLDPEAGVDADGDGSAELLAGKTHTGTLVVFDNGSLVPGSVLGVAEAVSTIVVEANHLYVTTAVAGDVNGDGYVDIAIGSAPADSPKGSVGVFCGAGARTIWEACSVILPGSDQDYLYAAPNNLVRPVGDVDGDGLAELWLGQVADQRVGVEGGCVLSGAELAAGGATILEDHAQCAYGVYDRASGAGAGLLTPSGVDIVVTAWDDTGVLGLLLFMPPSP